MPDPRDTVELTISGAPTPAPEPEPGPGPGAGIARPWLSVWFRCCHVYARVYRAPAGDRYTGRCPRCGVEVTARVGPGGTTRRFFEAS